MTINVGLVLKLNETLRLGLRLYILGVRVKVMSGFICSVFVTSFSVSFSSYIADSFLEMDTSLLYQLIQW